SRGGGKGDRPFAGLHREVHSSDARRPMKHRTSERAFGPARNGFRASAQRRRRGRTSRRHVVVAEDLGNADAVVPKDAGPSLLLGGAMIHVPVPSLYGGGIPPEGKRNILPLRGQALEPFDRDESIDPLQLFPQLRGEIEVALRRLVLQ